MLFHEYKHEALVKEQHIAANVSQIQLLDLTFKWSLDDETTLYRRSFINDFVHLKSPMSKSLICYGWEMRERLTFYGFSAISFFFSVEIRNLKSFSPQKFSVQGHSQVLT